MDKEGNAWGKNEDGTVNTSGPRVVVGDGNMGPQGGFVTKYVQRRQLCSFTDLAFVSPFNGNLFLALLSVRIVI